MRGQEIGCPAARRAAGRELLACYAALAERGAHLLDALVPGRAPRQWEHYPPDDVVDRDTGYQYFYHCHTAGKRGRARSHGHFHVFARLDNRRHRLDARHERRFAAALGLAAPQPACELAHLLGIALTSKGVPCELFTVNQWVTGDRILSARAVLRALDGFALRLAGDALVNRWLTALIVLYRPQIGRLLAARDQRLLAAARRRRRVALLEDRRLEVVSRLAIDVDARLRALRSA